MPDYETLYHIMFNAATDAVELFPDDRAKELLISAQQSCEDIYIEQSDDDAP